MNLSRAAGVEYKALKGETEGLAAMSSGKASVQAGEPVCNEEDKDPHNGYNVASE
jgi:hypothetical protein